jgi:hypothetical protein
MSSRDRVKCVRPDLDVRAENDGDDVEELAVGGLLGKPEKKDKYKLIVGL